MNRTSSPDLATLMNEEELSKELYSSFGLTSILHASVMFNGVSENHTNAIRYLCDKESKYRDSFVQSIPLKLFSIFDVLTIDYYHMFDTVGQKKTYHRLVFNFKSRIATRDTKVISSDFQWADLSHDHLLT